MGLLHDSLRRPLRALILVLVLALLVRPVPATWSIVVVNMKTGEVGIGTATCLTNTDISRAVPVIVPGHGAAAVQSTRDPQYIYRPLFQRALLEDVTPSEMFTYVSGFAGIQSRQIGIVGLHGDPLTFTGGGAGAAAGGVTGSVDGLRYAIQGNVLTGPEVWLAAEAALRETRGDLSQRLMASMEAARSFGGDGRCSCSFVAPDSCGAPPAGGFNKSAHCAFVAIARIGDPLGTCESNTGCATGAYWMRLNHFGLGNLPDPVLIVRQQYDLWREGLQGRPDQVLSEVAAAQPVLVADGRSKSRVDVRLVDVEGLPLATGGATLTLEELSEGEPVTSARGLVDHGDGTYSFELVAGSTAGSDLWRIAVTDAVGTVVLQPDVAVTVVPVGG